MSIYEGISAARQAYLHRVQSRKRWIMAAQLLILVGFFGLWELLGQAGIIDSFIMSQPSRIARTISNLLSNGLMTHIGVTCLETVAGFFLGTALGVFIALVLWWNPFISDVLEPYLVVLNSLPKIALGPVIIIWVGAGMQAIIVVALAISLVVTVLEMLGGFTSTDPERIKMAQTFGATRRQLFTKVVLPSNVPTLFNALKVNIGLSLVGVIAGEFLVSRAGLGYLIVYGGQVFQMDLVMSSVIILAAVAAILYQAVVFLEKVTNRFLNFSIH